MTLHRVRVVPVRLYSFDEGLVVDKVRVVGYPDGYVDFAPDTGNCHLQIQLWDDHNRQYSNQTVPCSTGHYVDNLIVFAEAA